MKKYVFLVVGIFILTCTLGASLQKHTSVKKSNIPIPEFNRDSAFSYVTKQVEFGPRVPNSLAHEKCAEYLSAQFASFGLVVQVQEAAVFSFDSTLLRAKNIIAQYNPELKHRILLCAHWDSRPFADNSENPETRDIPIDGANDGASGVGILMETARIIAQQDLPVGIDFILFDAEDYGIPNHKNIPYKPDTWCLGSQYWCNKPHKKNYHAKFGILLDMVGAPNATFYQEGYSMQTAKKYVKKIWSTASKKGFATYFIDKKGGFVTDDHIYIHNLRDIPCVDIIHLDPSTQSGFGKYWHTHNDNMDSVNKNTLYAVGQTILEILFHEK